LKKLFLTSDKTLTMSPKIVPKIVPKTSSDAKGIDICRTSDYIYIVRSDLGCFLRTKDLSVGGDVKAFKLNDNCMWGDAYMHDEYGPFYIIFGDQVRSCKHLGQFDDDTYNSLDDKCKGGDHYFCWSTEFVVVKGLYSQSFSGLFPTKYPVNPITPELPLPSMMTNGLYYWGDKYSYCLKPEDSKVTYNYCVELGIDYNKGLNQFMPKDVIRCLPGGVAQVLGPAWGKWVLAATQPNDSDNAMILHQYPINTGFTHFGVDDLTDSWDIEDTPDILTGLLKYQFKIDPSFGGVGIDTSDFTWEDYPCNENVPINGNVQIPPNEVGYIWMLTLGFGDCVPWTRNDPGTTVLICPKLQLTLSSEEPPFSPGSCTVRVGAKL